MLKLKHLFKNTDLAHMILNNWAYDNDEDPNFLKYYRISSNAVYWCKNQGNLFFLRFAPAEEKSKEKILAELEFLSYLRKNGYSAVDTILSKAGNELEAVDTPWGAYYATAFKKACGKQLSQIPLTDDMIFGWGKTLGKLHRISSGYKAVAHVRSDWKGIMDWMEGILADFPDEAAAKNELNILREYFLKLPVGKENFGLIHYDFEMDNLFYDEDTKTFTPIDFDDAVYHWYGMDVWKAVESLKEEMSEEQLESAVSRFIEGYRSEYGISEEMLRVFPVFERYDNLYSYVRLLRSMKEKWNHEPEWMVGLRGRLENSLNRKKDMFEKPI